MSPTSSRRAKCVSTPTYRAPAGPNFPADQAARDAHKTSVGGDPQSVGQRDQRWYAAHGSSVSLFDPTLSILAEALDDAENVRKAQANRLARDLWTEAKRLHELGTGQSPHITHGALAGADSTRRST